MCAFSLSSLGMSVLQVPHVQQQLLEHNMVGFLLQEMSQTADIQSTGSRTHLKSEKSASRLAADLRISVPSRRAAEGSQLSIKRTSAGLQTQVTDSPHIPAHFPVDIALAALRTSRGAVKAQDHQEHSTSSEAAAPSLGMFGDLKVPPGFVSSGDLEEDLDRLMELESQVCHFFILYRCACMTRLGPQEGTG